MNSETQKLVDLRNQKMVKAMEELQKLPYSQEQRTHQVNQAYKAHGQVNPNKKKSKTMKTVEISEEVNGLKMNFTCNLTDEEYQMYQKAMEQGKTQEEALKTAQTKKSR